MKELKILLTGSGAPGWVPIFKCLISNPDHRPLEIYGCDIQSVTAGSYYAKKHFTVPSGIEKNYIKTIIDICKENQIRIIIPLTDSELTPLAKHKNLLKKYNITVPISSHKALKVALDKYRLYNFLSKVDINVPQFIIVDNWRDFKKAIKQLGYPNLPICFKPTIAWGSRGFRILNPLNNSFQMLFNEKPNSTQISYTEILSVLKNVERFPKLLVMEYLPGNEYSVDILSDTRSIRYCIPRLRLKTKGGITTEGIVENNKELIDLSKKIVKTLDLHYSVGIQFKYDKYNKPKVLEINPRLQGTTIMATGAGVNLPYFCIKALLNEEIPEIIPIFGVSMIRHWQEVFFKQNVKISHS